MSRAWIPRRRSPEVRQLATGKGFLFSDLGDVVPKGFEESVSLYEVRWQEDAWKMQANDKIRFLRSLRAVRHYSPEQIPEDVLSDILEVGR